MSHSLKNGKIIKFKSNCDNLIKELNFTFKNIKNSNRIGEIGFGTNISLKKFYNVIGIDEKYPGNHIAFGNPYGEKTNASWTSKIHVDCVIKKCNTWINGKQILKNGKYLI